MKTIKGTFIDTGSHGYLSIAKKDLIAIEYPYEKISRYSGHNLTRVFLEEDCDASDLVEFCREKKIPFDFKESYNPNFSITHNYEHELFNIKFNIGDKYVMADNSIGEVIENKNKIIISVGYMRYKLPKTNPFKYIKSVL
jgi:hypothetical protein